MRKENMLKVFYSLEIQNHVSCRHNNLKHMQTGKIRFQIDIIYNNLTVSENRVPCRHIKLKHTQTEYQVKVGIII